MIVLEQEDILRFLLPENRITIDTSAPFKKKMLDMFLKQGRKELIIDSVSADSSSIL